MSPLERELRWERVWNISTLDITHNLSGELLVPVYLKRVLVELRSVLNAHYSRTGYGVLPGLLHLHLAAELYRLVGWKEFTLFVIWAERTLFLSGVDRSAEAFWCAAIYNVGDVPRPEWIGQLFRNVQQRQDDLRVPLAQKMEREATEVSAWDSGVLARIEMSLRSLRSSLDLTSKYNIFRQAWNLEASRLSSEQLIELHTVGHSIAATMHLSETDVAFPGVWRFESEDGGLAQSS